MAVLTGLSGNEIYCLHLQQMTPGDLVLGNAVYSMGFLGNVGAGIRNLVGGEVSQITQIIHEGRLQSFQRMVAEAQQHGGLGISGVTSELRAFHGNVEFLSVGSAVHADPPQRQEKLSFSTAHDAQELYCQIDAGYRPIRFVFGNVAYSVGVAGGLIGSLKSMSRGEVKQFSDVFNHTRHLALERISNDAAQDGANVVVGIETTVMPFQGVHEMMMMGTASHNPMLPPPGPNGIITSDLTSQEMWNMTAMGYAPLKLVLGTAVYSLGVVGGIMAALKSFSRGEVNDLTTLIYDAREHALGLIRDEANRIGADDVVGVKTYIHDMGNLLEFMAIGTAVKKAPGVKTTSAILPPQAIMHDKDTWISKDTNPFVTLSNRPGR
jgi:uncharacterized protein YbjQ (UPF0145 family)